MPRFHLATFCITLAFLTLVGCGTSEIATRPTSATVQARALPSASASEVEVQLLGAAESWLGVPYRFGGTTTRGVDCSALVRAIYAGAFGLQLSRSTRTQVREGRSVHRNELRSGDLVFFRTGPNQRHVGIYLDGDRLLHASSSQNRVLVDDFNRDHFQRTYWTARRLLDVSTQPVAVRPAPRRAAPPPVRTSVSGPARPGW